MMSRKALLSTYELVLFPALGVLMFTSKLLMEFLPNIHLLGMFIMVFTLVYRWKALIPLYIYVFLLGIYGGFAPWWFANLYTWLVLWMMAMLLPKRMPRWLCAIVYPTVCALHGFAYGVLCVPAEVLFLNLPWESVPLWLVKGIPFDISHGVSNLFAGLLIIPIKNLLHRLNRIPQKA